MDVSNGFDDSPAAWNWDNAIIKVFAVVLFGNHSASKQLSFAFAISYKTNDYVTQNPIQERNQWEAVFVLIYFKKNPEHCQCYISWLCKKVFQALF